MVRGPVSGSSPTFNCAQEVSNFYLSFKQSLSKAAAISLDNLKRTDQANCAKHYEIFRHFNFKVLTGSRNKDGLEVRFSFSNKIQLVARIHNRWQVKRFALGALSEGRTLSPEG